MTNTTINTKDLTLVAHANDKLDNFMQTEKKIFAHRSSPHQLRVEQLMQLIELKSGEEYLKLPLHPTVPIDNIRLNRAQFIFEETLEAIDALGIGLYLNKKGEEKLHTGYPLDLSCFELMVEKADNEIDLSHVAKELADVSVVTIGTMSACGICDMPILEEVDYNNLKKFGPDGKLINGKWQKPQNHPKPDILQLLIAQGYNPDAQEERSNEKENASVSVPSRGD